MDPNTLWHDLAMSVQLDDWESAEVQARDLLEWLDKKGFPPSITGQQAFDAIVARCACQAVISWEVD